MNKWYWLLACLLFTSNPWAKQTIKISTSEWPPYISKDSPNYGYISQTIEEAFALVDIDVEFVFMPWARAYQEAKVGHVSATSYWYKDHKHAEYFYFSEPLSSEKVVFFRLKSEKPSTWQSLSDFDGLAIGLTRSFTYTKELWQYAENNSDSISIVTTDEQNFKKLLLGRIDITPAQEIVGWSHLQSLFAKVQINRVEMMQPPLTIQTGHLLFPKVNKNSKELLKQFNEGLSILTKNGRLEELKEQLILGRYSK